MGSAISKFWGEASRSGSSAATPNSRKRSPDHYSDELADTPIREDPTEHQEGNAVEDACLPYVVIRRVPKSEYPIQVYHGPHIPISEEAQRRVFRYRYEKWEDSPRNVWLQEPNVDAIKEVVLPYIQRIQPHFQDLDVELLINGGFNKVYTVKATTPVLAKEYIFRVALPTDPYYKTESDVATTELVRACTNIPVPTVIAYDSSSSNLLGFEWMLMEKVEGKPLSETWDSLDYDAKLEITRTVAHWTQELLEITCDTIGSIYMRTTQTHREFYVGPSVAHWVSCEGRLWSGMPRGPYRNLENYFSAILAFHKHEIKLRESRARQELQTSQNGGEEISAAYDQQEEHCKERSVDEQTDIFQKADRDDAKYYNWRQLPVEYFSQLIEHIDQVESCLPELCRRAVKDLLPLLAAFWHQDLSANNIFVNDSGSLIAVLDWEHTQLIPLPCINPCPRLLNAAYREDDPGPLDEDVDKYAARGWSQEEIDEQLEITEEHHLEQLDEYHCTMLQREFKTQLENVFPKAIQLGWAESDSFLVDLWNSINSIADGNYDRGWLEQEIGGDAESDGSD